MNICFCNICIVLVRDALKNSYSKILSVIRLATHCFPSNLLWSLYYNLANYITGIFLRSVGDYLVPLNSNIPAYYSPDNEMCLLPKQNATRSCIYGGPRLYYTVNGDTYDIIARRLNIAMESVMSNMKPNETATTPLAPGQFVKIPICYLSKCVVQLYSFKYGVYKDLAEKFGTTVGRIMILSPTYNYSATRGNSAVD